MAIDYGRKRVGLAVTDPLQLIATALDTVPTHQIITYLKNYLAQEKVDLFVIGDPKNLDNTPAESAPLVKSFINQLHQQFPHIPIIAYDERFTSKIAFQSMIASGKKKKYRQKKEHVDKISAVIILQSYMERITSQSK